MRFITKLAVAVSFNNFCAVRNYSNTTMVKAKAYIFHKQFDGFPKASDLKLIEEDLPPIKDGEFLSEAVYLSVDPYQRAYAPNLPLGKTFIGSQVAKIIQSKNPKYPVGKYVVGEFGWRSHTISSGANEKDNFPAPWIIPDFGKLPLSLALGILGMPGNTAYFGFLELTQPKAGETVAITGAAGAVGNIVGQMAKLKGCTVIGIAGSEEKGKWLVDELKFDHFINYKDPDFVQKLNKAAPKGIDIYFDNVGGEISNQIMNKMNLYGRVSVCGAISGYNDRAAAKASYAQFPILFHQLKVEGFIVTRWRERWSEGISANLKWIEEGKLQYRETVTEGFENMFQGFVDMLQGKNTGKAVIKV